MNNVTIKIIHVRSPGGGRPDAPQLAGGYVITPKIDPKCHCEPSRQSREAKQSVCGLVLSVRDCFVAALLAKTFSYFVMAAASGHGGLL